MPEADHGLRRVRECGGGEGLPAHAPQAVRRVPGTDQASKLTGFLGVPHVTGGRDPATGEDCLALSIRYLAARGIPWADPWERFADRYSGGWRDFREARPAGFVELLPSAPIIANDVIVCASSLDPANPNHIAVSVDRWWGLHSLSGRPSMLIAHRRLVHKLWLWRYEG